MAMMDLPDDPLDDGATAAADDDERPCSFGLFCGVAAALSRANAREEDDEGDVAAAAAALLLLLFPSWWRLLLVGVP